MVKVPIGNGRMFALLDDGDAHLAEFKWSRHSAGYAVRGYTVEPGVMRWTSMHREVLGLTDATVHVDHINRDKLDNRRSNLRTCRGSENAQNVAALGGSSPYRGVSYSEGAWHASAGIRNLGRFRTELDAARAAEATRRQHMPFAVPDPALDPVPACPCRTCLPVRPREARTIERNETIRALWAEGLPASEIADRIGWTVGSLQGHICRLRRAGVDLPRRKRFSAAALESLTDGAKRGGLAGRT